MKTTALILLVVLATFASASLITSAGRDFPTAYSTGLGAWHYHALFDNGTTARLTYKNTAPTYWSDLNPTGNGLVSNSSGTFQAEPGVSLFIQRGPIESGRTDAYNMSINWTSNVSTLVNISGWYKNWGNPYWYQYNVTIYKNKQLLYENPVGVFVLTNYTYGIVTPVTFGDNLSLVLSTNTTSQFPAINATMYITDFTSSGIIINTPADYTSNKTLTIPFGFTPSLYNQTPTDVIVNASVWTNATTWLPTLNTSPVLNNTLNWINITFAQPGVYQWAVMLCGSIQCNTTGNYTVNLTTPRVYIQAYDAVSLGRIYFDATLSNTTNTTNFYGNYWLNKSVYEIPTSPSAVTFTISNGTSYYPSAYSYSITLNQTNDTAFSAYLQPVSNTTIHFVRFSVKDLGQVPIQTATVQVQKQIGGVYTTIAQQDTDSSGTAAFYLDALTAYNVIITKAGYITSTSTLVPSGTDYMYTLSSTGGSGFSYAYSDTTSNLTPSSLSSYLFTINASVNSTDCNLKYYALNITLANLTQLAFVNQTDACGGFLTSGVINAGGWNNTNLTAVLSFKKDGASEYGYAQYYFIYNFTSIDTNSSLTVIFQNIGNTNMSGATKGVFAVLTSTLVATGGWLASGPVGAGFLFVSVMALWTQAGWFQIELLYLLIAVVLSIILINRF